ncbi:MAG: metallophosphoesterase [Roseovarius sp.]|nr:metallophosphoesterase [Roseovarius sp.]MBK43986.1 metallophosphoesterase [Roseovarius sp.]
MRLAHLSDVHLPLPDRVDWRAVLNKRALSLLSWRRKRHLIHRPEVLARLVADIHAAAPDLIAVTGDLTNLGLPQEYAQARGWLDALGKPEGVMVIPGNHDALVRGAWEAGAQSWRPFWQGDDGGGFPWLRRRGGLALIGLSSAVASAPGRAVGAVGAAQLDRLAALLAGARAEGLCRVVMVHHPPLGGTVRARKRLLDAPALCAVLAQEGVELVLHGHSHRSHHQQMETASGVAPVIGVPSASATRPEAAAWHRYHIAPVAGGWQVTLTARRHAPGGMETGHAATHHLIRAHAEP